jgi:phosphoribosyl 1,2-cyclic phosphate phosphodiesterase
MRVTFLGTGTSAGVPLIGCDCPVCTSKDPRNRRRRTSLYVQAGGVSIAVDTPPDFREQALQYGVTRVDAVIFTHAHADHIFGFDDIRRFNTLQGAAIPAYGLPDTIEHIRTVFHYIHEGEEPGLYRPRIEFHQVNSPFEIGKVSVSPLSVEHDAHGRPTVGYLLKADGRSLGYVPDCSRMPGATAAALRGVDVMILDTLGVKRHRTHLSLTESVEILKDIGAAKSFIIHMGHGIDHGPVQATMPAGMFVSHDGLVLEW